MGKVLHASKSGWFPFCLPSFDPTGLVNFTSASKEIVMKSFWVLRNFTLSGSYIDLNLNPRQFSITLGSGATKEENIVCNPSWEVKSYSNVNSIVGTWYDSSHYFYNYNNLIVPDYSISGLFDGAGGGGFALKTLDGSGYSETFSFEGMTLFGVGGFSITPNAYWSYDGTWNPQTGQRLT